jgi:hypothetical protein
MLGGDKEEDGSADADAVPVGPVVSIDKGALSSCVADIAAFEVDDDSCSGFVFSLAVSAAGVDSDMAEDLEMGGKKGDSGDVVGIETSLRGPCEPAPVAVLGEGSRWVNSTGG